MAREKGPRTVKRSKVRDLIQEERFSGKNITPDRTPGHPLLNRRNLRVLDYLIGKKDKEETLPDDECTLIREKKSG